MTRWFTLFLAPPVLALGCTLISVLSVLLLACTAAEPAPTGPAADSAPPRQAVNQFPQPSRTRVPAMPTAATAPAQGGGSGLPPDAFSPDAFSPDTFPPAPDRDQFRLAAELRLNTDPDQIPRTVNRDSVTDEPGRQEKLWLVDLGGPSVYQSDFTLQLVTPHAYWYVEDGLAVADEDLAEASREFEAAVYPVVTAAFGQEWLPGVDHDPHLSIVHGAIDGLAGYYSTADEYPQEVMPFSNEREAIYINARSVPVGSRSYLNVLAHELQHAVHWNHDPSEETWVNEGLSELAVQFFRSSEPRINIGFQAPGVSLVNWAAESGNAGANYRAASLFFHYLAEHYSDDGDMRPLVAEPGDGIAGIDAYLAAQGYDATFADVFADWTVANFLDRSPGVYGYEELAIGARLEDPMSGFSKFQSELPQYSAQYVELAGLTGPARIRFFAPAATPLLPVTVDDRGCWWGNSGDSIASTLTHRVDLRGVTEARLEYDVWHEIEEGWDYAYLQVSTNQGQTWDVLETPNSSPPNETGTGFGPGYSGRLDWTGERVDLTPYAGHQVAVRFQYVTDAAIHSSGICIREPVVAADGQAVSGSWEPDGFILTDNRVPQEFIVQVIQENGEVQVDRIALDAANTGEFTVTSPEDLDRLVVVVAALAHPTRQPASYTLSVEPAAAR